MALGAPAFAGLQSDPAVEVTTTEPTMGALAADSGTGMATTTTADATVIPSTTTTSTTAAPTTTTTTAPPATEAPAATAAPTTAAPTTAAPTTAAPTTAAPTTAPPTTAAPTTASTASDDDGEGYGPKDPRGLQVWLDLAECESGGNWRINTGNGYYGGLQFSHGTWQNVGGTGYPHEHPRDVQIEMGRRLQAQAGWGQWPHCSSELGLR